MDREVERRVKVEEEDIISWEDARSSAKSFEHIGYALKSYLGLGL